MTISLKWYRAISACLSVAFAATGLVFLFLPNYVAPAPDRFFVVLAVAYMYVVTVLAGSMFRQPRNPVFPFLLAHAKLFSSVLSLGVFALFEGRLIYLANAVVDGAIGFIALALWKSLKRPS